MCDQCGRTGGTTNLQSHEGASSAWESLTVTVEGKNWGHVGGKDYCSLCTEERERKRRDREAEAAWEEFRAATGVNGPLDWEAAKTGFKWGYWHSPARTSKEGSDRG